jgi:Domain of unknown function (DUF4384)
MLFALPALAVSAAVNAQPSSELSSAQQAFLQVVPTENPIRIEIYVDRKNQRYVIGEPVTISVIPKEDAYLHIFSIDTQGKATLLYPNEYAPAVKASGGVQLTFPKASEPWQIVGDREGTELIKVIAGKSSQPLAVNVPFDQAGPFRIYRASGQEFARQLQSEGDADATGRWGQASLVMTIGRAAGDLDLPAPLSEAELIPRTGPLDGLAKNLPPRPKSEPLLY